METMSMDLKLVEVEENIEKIISNKISVNDFSILKVIGKGSYGKVLLVKKKDDHKIYAMKILKKINIIIKNQIEHIKTERRILESTDHPFIMKLKFAFQNIQNLYLVMDYCPGGELFYHIQRLGRFNEESAKFYASQIVLALEYLHQINIVYRDLKPENVLIDREGYIKIIDFGLSKQNIIDTYGTHTFCGTPEYLAPEIIDNKGHGKAVDWWSFGAILFEMLTGRPPFTSSSRDRLFKNIQSGIIKYPPYISNDSLSLLKGLLTRDPEKRLGFFSLDEIKKHPFFYNIDWDAILNKKVLPPFIPKISDESDTKYIDIEFTNLTPYDSLSDNNEDDQDETYKDFSYHESSLVEKEK